jgi:hypothetical protein
MDSPNRALGREDDVRIDAQLLTETVSPGSPIGVLYQIENLTNHPVAVAEKVADASYDEETRTITVAIGSEIPTGEHAPKLTVVAPGEKKIFRAAATAALNVRGSGSVFNNEPRYVQLKVSILRDIDPFAAIIQQQARGPQRLSDDLFDRWMESNDTIYLNTLPVRYAPSRGLVSAADRAARGSF